MSIISASAVSRLADWLDFSEAVNNTAAAIADKHAVALKDQFDKLYARFDQVFPDIITDELFAKADAEIARRRGAADRELQRRAMRNKKDEFHEARCENRDLINAGFELLHA